MISLPIFLQDPLSRQISFDQNLFPVFSGFSKEFYVEILKYFLPISMQVESCEKQPDTYMYVLLY